MRIWQDIRAFIRIPGTAVLASTLFFYGISNGILAPMNAIYLKDSIGLNKGEIASIFAIALMLNMLTTISVGIISDRMKRKKTLPIIALLLCMTGLVFYMNADDYVSALFGMSFILGPSGLIMGQLFAMARSHFTLKAPDIIEMAQIWLRATYSIGFFCGLLLGANLYLLATFQGVIWGNLVGLVALFLLLLFYKEITADAASAPSRAGEPFSWLMLFVILLLSCSEAIRGLYMPLVVNELFGDPRIMSYLWSIQAVFELLFMTLAGYWAVTYGYKPVILLGSVCALATYLIYIFSGGSLTLFFVVQPLYSIFVSILYGVGMGFVQRMFLHRAGFGASLYVFITQMASLIGYILPLIVEGVKPNIFWIPASLIMLSIALMVTVLMSKQAGLNQAA